MNNKVLMLFSGGPDCVVAAAVLKQKGFEITNLHFQYGQKAAARERQAVERLSEAMGAKLIVQECNVFTNIRSSLLEGDNVKGRDLAGRAAYVPARNLIFFAIATGMSQGLDAGYIGIGNIAMGGNVDNYPEFTKRVDALLPYALTDHHVRAISPVNHLLKPDVIKLGLELKAPLHLSWSCYESGKDPCGDCAGCTNRKKAFDAIGATDKIEL